MITLEKFQHKISTDRHCTISEWRTERM